MTKITKLSTAELLRKQGNVERFLDAMTEEQAGKALWLRAITEAEELEYEIDRRHFITELWGV